MTLNPEARSLLRQVAGPPVSDDRLDPALAVPAHVAGWRRPARDGART